MWFDGKFYKANEKGAIFIPYGSQLKSDKIIMIHGHFAQLGDFERKTESYSFSAKMYLNQESLLLT